MKSYQDIARQAGRIYDITFEQTRHASASEIKRQYKRADRANSLLNRYAKNIAETYGKSIYELLDDKEAISTKFPKEVYSV